MLITIESVDEDSVQPLGFTKLPSFVVRFTSPEVLGVARFVPAAGTADRLVGMSCYVEINQERVTEFRPISHEAAVSISPLPVPGSFLIVGTVKSLSPFVTVAVRDSTLILEAEDHAGHQLALGEQVTFVAHDLSLWDEAI